MVMEENRLALIRRWSMAGTCEDLGMRAEAPLDTHAVAAAGDEHEGVAEPGRAMQLREPLGEHDRRSLVAEPTPA
jgi:hypothetical protein